MMSEYIERSAAIKAVLHAVNSGLAATADDLEEVLEDCPAADAIYARLEAILVAVPEDASQGIREQASDLLTSIFCEYIGKRLGWGKRS